MCAIFFFINFQRKIKHFFFRNMDELFHFSEEIRSFLWVKKYVLLFTFFACLLVCQIDFFWNIECSPCTRKTPRWCTEHRAKPILEGKHVLMVSNQSYNFDCHHHQYMFWSYFDRETFLWKFNKDCSEEDETRKSHHGRSNICLKSSVCVTPKILYGAYQQCL